MALEGFVAQHLRACAAYRGGEDRLYYWRTKSGSEVQIILYGSNEFVTREIKRAERIRNSDLRALKAFRENYREAHVSVLFLGPGSNAGIQAPWMANQREGSERLRSENHSSVSQI
jgi:predicted AAA+ superfamily ATPase